MSEATEIRAKKFKGAVIPLTPGISGTLVEKLPGFEVNCHLPDGCRATARFTNRGPTRSQGSGPGNRQDLQPLIAVPNSADRAPRPDAAGLHEGAAAPRTKPGTLRQLRQREHQPLFRPVA